MKFNDVKIFYGLFLWGGKTPGQRPRTALFKVYKRTEDGDLFKAARIDINGDELTRNLTTFGRSDLVHGWTYLPEFREVASAKESIPVTEGVRDE